MNRIIAVTAIWALSLVVLILTMIHGWGLEPKSWWWIIGAGCFGRIATEIVGIIAKNAE